MNSFETYRQQIETQIATTQAKALNANQIANATTADTLLSDLLISNANTQQVFLTLLDQLTAGGVNNDGSGTQYVVSTVNDPALDDALKTLTTAVNTAIAGLIGTQTAMNTYLQALGDLTALSNAITAQVASASTSASSASNASYAANLAAEVATGTLQTIQQEHAQIVTSAAAVAADRALTQEYRDTTLGYRNAVFTALSSLSSVYYPAGSWNAATNTAPPTPTNGAPVYRIVNSGTILGIVYHEGDDIFWNGTNGWFKVDNSERFTSINGYTNGNINITYLDVGAASAAQGTKADTAVQPVDLGVYVTATSLTNRLTSYVTFSSQAVTLANYATADSLTSAVGTITLALAGKATTAQGAKADTAIQPNDLLAYSTTVSMNAAISSALSSYVTTTTLNSNLSGYVTASGLDTRLLSYATVAQGTKADTAVQPATLSSYQTINAFNTAMTGYTNTTGLMALLAGYASSAQGAKADSAVQPAALSSYVTNTVLATTLSSYITNSYLTTTLSNYASSAQGTKADTAVQPATLSSYVTNSGLTTSLGAYVTTSALATTLGNYASSAQGAKADTALQASALTPYVTTVAMNTALAAYVTNVNLASTLAGYASSAQGAKADSAVQPAALSSYVTASSLSTTLSSYIYGTLTTSTSDATVGRVLKVGDFGIGSVAVSNTNWDSVTAAGVYVNATTGDTGIPAALTGLVLEHTGIDVNNATQMAMATTSNRLWMRRKVAGSWQSWVELYHSGNLSNLTIGGGLTINGDLIVTGSTTTATTTVVTSTDPVLQLGGSVPLTTDDGKDRGIMYRWYNGVASKLGFFGLHEASGHFTFIPDATNTGEVFTGALGTIEANLQGNASTASALNTSVSISMTGDMTWTIPAFTGSGNVTATGTLANTSVSAGSYGSSSAVATFTVDGKGRLTAAGNVTITPAAIGAATTAQGAKADTAVQPAALSSYVTSSGLTTTLGSYVTNSALTTTLGGYATSTQGAKADSAVQPATLSSYVTSSGLTTTLGSYVTSSSLTTTLSNYASSAQGAKADSAVQPATLSSYVTNSNLTTTLGSYVTSSGLTTTLAGYASSAQGAKADTAVQPATLSSYVTNTTLTTTLAGYVTNSSLTTTLAGYATSTQGAKADTALQPAALNGYATQSWVTGQNYVVAGTAGAYASVAQGAKADTALQPTALPNGLTFDQMMGLIYAGL